MTRSRTLLASLLALFALGCSAEEGDAGTPAGGGGAGGAGGSIGGGGAGGGAGGIGASCATDVPCLSDVQCAALPGHVCATGLAAPVCVLLRCAEAGEPCVDDTHCTAANLCRDLDHAGSTECSNAAVFAVADCLRSCETTDRAWVADGAQWIERCDPVFEAACQALCADQTLVCSSWGGIRDIQYARCDLSRATPEIFVSARCRDVTAEEYTYRAE